MQINQLIIFQHESVKKGKNMMSQLGVIPLDFHQDLWHETTTVPALLHGLICVILHLALHLAELLTSDRSDTVPQHIPC